MTTKASESLIAEWQGITRYRRFVEPCEQNQSSRSATVVAMATADNSPKTPSRRDMMRWSLYGIGSVPLAAAVLAACSDDAKTKSGTATKSEKTAEDPAKKWWLEGNFAPVKKEVEEFDLDVKGAIPTALAGLYVRNGSNPSSGDSSHWFFGDGMGHGMRLENGKAKSYRNRYVQTSLYKTGADFGSGPPGGEANQGNVSFINHGGKLLSSGEVGFPYELSPEDLSTVGAYDFGGKLTGNFTAHPKIDPATGNLHFFGYGFTEPFLMYHVADATGQLIHSEPVPAKGGTMVHDFAITESDAVFWELPVVFDMEGAAQWLKDPDSGAMPFKWDPGFGARVGVMPLGGPASAIQWSDIDPCYVFHGVNAHRDGANVVLDVCRLSSMFNTDGEFAGDLSLRRWTVDTDNNRVSDEIIDTDDGAELPSRDPRLVGRPYRYGYFAQTRPTEGTVDMGGLIKRDYKNGTREIWDPGPTKHTGEWLFVPDPDDKGEDAGYLLTYLYDDTTEKSELVIVDATEIKKGPIARVALPQRVPYGFHATWVPV